jgi:hypothetical protein
MARAELAQTFERVGRRTLTSHRLSLLIKAGTTRTLLVLIFNSALDNEEAIAPKDYICKIIISNK